MENNPNLICNGEFEIIRLTKEWIDEAVDLYEEHFIKVENICKATYAAKYPKTVKELRYLAKTIIEQGLSFGARHVATNELAAICVNQIINPSNDCTLEHLFETFDSPPMQVIGSYLSVMVDSVNVFKEYRIDCVLEIEFLVTSKKYGGKSLATTLTKHTIKFAKRMLNGQLTKEELDVIVPYLRIERPKMITSVFTSFFTQRIGDKLGFRELFKARNSDFDYEGVSFSSRIDPIHEYSIYAALRL